MKTILILTVGGSHQPIVTSILQHRPNFVHYLCSDDREKLKGSYTQVVSEGKVLKSSPDKDKPDLPNIVTLAGLATGQFEVHKIAQYDDLNACYLVAHDLIERLRRETPEVHLLADYTGGTKSMTAGLAAAALDDGRCELSLVTGRRSDLVKVQDQTEFVRHMQVWDAQALRRIQAAEQLLAHYDYASAEQLLRDAAARFTSERTLEVLQRGIALCHAFDAWDKFDHVTARRLLRPYKDQFTPYWRFVGWLSREDPGSHGFERIEDLLRNAERRAAQGRFDDAVGRVYRAIELTAQVWLEQRHGINTSDVNPAAVPDAVRSKVAQNRSETDGKIKIGLLLAWDLLAAFTADPLGERFSRERGLVLNFLTVRNQSLFAHGSDPISRTDCNRFLPTMATLLNDCITAALEATQKKRPVVLGQLPTNCLNLCS
jgi:hypothetical protein